MYICIGRYPAPGKICACTPCVRCVRCVCQQLQVPPSGLSPDLWNVTTRAVVVSGACVSNEIYCGQGKAKYSKVKKKKKGVLPKTSSNLRQLQQPVHVRGWFLLVTTTTCGIHRNLLRSRTRYKTLLYLSHLVVVSVLYYFRTRCFVYTLLAVLFIIVFIYILYAVFGVVIIV